jgi:hypothetical protein
MKTIKMLPIPMNMQIKNLILGLICLLLPTFSVWAQVTFVAKPSKTTLGVNERLRIDFTMNGNGDYFQAPSFDNFQVISGPIQQVSQSWVNGKSSFNKTYSFILMPAKQGQLTIGSASIEINGETYETDPIKITVTKAVAEPREASDNREPPSDAVHLVAEVSSMNPFVNEPITVVYKLYVSYDVNVSNWQELEKPKYNNFWSQNIDIDRLDVKDGEYKGQKYRYAILRKTVLFPQKEGVLEIEPLSLNIDMEIPTQRRDFFGRYMMTRAQKKVTAGTQKINVKPLPDADKPIDFSGGVGDLSFKVVASRNQVKYGESLDLNLEVKGKGNLKLMNLPKPVIPGAFEVYDPIKDEAITTNLSGMSGSISEKYTLIPQMQGTYKVPPISFTYFDLKSRKYKTITSEEISIEVLDGPTQNDKSQANQASNKIAVVANKSLKYIHLETQLKPISNRAFLGSTTFYLYFFIPFLMIPLLIFIKKRREKIAGDFEGQKVKFSNRLAKKYFSEAKRQIGNQTAFYIALEKSLHNFLKAKLKIETSEMQKDTIQEILNTRNAENQTIELFIKLLENCEFARYAPSTSVNMQEDFENAVTIISTLEKQLR